MAIKMQPESNAGELCEPANDWFRQQHGVGLFKNTVPRDGTAEKASDMSDVIGDTAVVTEQFLSADGVGRTGRLKHRPNALPNGCVHTAGETQLRDCTRPVFERQTWNP